jgi:hypothetical protein
MNYTVAQGLQLRPPENLHTIELKVVKDRHIVAVQYDELQGKGYTVILLPSFETQLG